MKLVAVALLLPPLAGAAGAQTVEPSPPAVPAATPAPEPVKPKKVCRRESDIGSSIQRSTCHTAAEWATIDGRGRRSTSDSLAIGPR